MILSIKDIEVSRDWEQRIVELIRRNTERKAKIRAAYPDGQVKKGSRKAKKLIDRLNLRIIAFLTYQGQIIQRESKSLWMKDIVR